jgi:hypothetical protein
MALGAQCMWLAPVPVPLECTACTAWYGCVKNRLSSASTPSENVCCSGTTMADSGGQTPGVPVIVSSQVEPSL